MACVQSALPFGRSEGADPNPGLESRTPARGISTSLVTQAASPATHPPKPFLSVLSGTWGGERSQSNVHSCTICPSLKEERSQAPVSQPTDRPMVVHPKMDATQKEHRERGSTLQPAEAAGREAE